MTIPTDSFPQFESWPAAEDQSGLAGPFDPHTRQSLMWSQRADKAYKRLTMRVPEGCEPVVLDRFNLELQRIGSPRSDGAVRVGQWRKRTLTRPAIS